MINGVSSGQILKLQNFGGTRKLTTDKIFGMISIQLGGDGRSISRENLKQYIQKADDGLINCSEKQLKAFKLLDENWKDLFGDTDSITARDFNKASGIFAQIILAKEDKSDLEKLQDEIQKQVEIINNLINKNTTYTKAGTEKQNEATAKTSTVEYKI